MTEYSVQQLSAFAGVSVRTLHYYDQVSLLKPARRSEKGYRYYGKEEMLKLQQILFYRELDFPLKEIGKIINDRRFNLLEGLEFHKAELEKRAARYQALLATLEKTIVELKTKKKMMTEEEMYKGFTKEEVKTMRREVVERWGEEELLAVEERIRLLGKEGWEDHQQKGDEINELLAELSTLGPGDERVQHAVALHHRHLNFYYEVDEERYRGLGKMYVEDQRFNDYYEKYRQGLANFLQKAINVFCDNGMVASKK